MSGDPTTIAYVAIEVHENYTMVPTFLWYDLKTSPLPYFPALVESVITSIQVSSGYFQLKIKSCIDY